MSWVVWLASRAQLWTCLDSLAKCLSVRSPARPRYALDILAVDVWPYSLIPGCQAYMCPFALVRVELPTLCTEKLRGKESRTAFAWHTEV